MTPFSHSAESPAELSEPSGGPDSGEAAVPPGGLAKLSSGQDADGAPVSSNAPGTGEAPMSSGGPVANEAALVGSGPAQPSALAVSSGAPGDGRAGVSLSLADQAGPSGGPSEPFADPSGPSSDSSWPSARAAASSGQPAADEAEDAADEAEDAAGRQQPHVRARRASASGHGASRPERRFFTRSHSAPFGDVDASGKPLLPRTLAVDCGGGGIKTALLDAAGFQLGSPQRTAVRYPFSPTDLLRIVSEHAATFDGFERITLGMPGMIRHGVVVYTPHYIRRAGPHTRVEPELASAWERLDMEAHLSAKFGVPALVLNDAEVAAAGVVIGEGCELVLTLGTGLGSALVDDGRLAPHLEMSHAQMRWGLTYDDVVGESERIRLGDAAWSRRVLRAVDTLWPVFRWDHLYIGGGNSSRISTSARAKLGENVAIIPNAAGMNGGVRAWSMAKPGRMGAR